MDHWIGTFSRHNLGNSNFTAAEPLSKIRKQNRTGKAHSKTHASVSVKCPRLSAQYYKEKAT